MCSVACSGMLGDMKRYEAVENVPSPVSVIRSVMLLL